MLNGIYSLSEQFPGIDKIPTMFNLRTIGSGRETFGAGFMYKPKGQDFLHSSIGHYALIYVVKGNGRYISEDGTESSLSKGMIFQRRPDMIHSNYIDSDDEWFEGFIAIGRKMYESLKAMGVFKSQTPIIAESVNTAHEERLLRQFYSIAVRMSSFDEKQILSILADELETLQELLNIRAPKDEVELYCSIVTQSPEKRIDLRMFCDEHGYGYESFRKKFRKITGTSPVAFALERRTARAKELLKSTNLQINEISGILGYTNQNEFSNQFKKHSKSSPTQFRRFG